jgi:hypothetical protein
MTARQALDHIKIVAAERESIYACYVLEPDSGHLLGAVSGDSGFASCVCPSAAEIVHQHSFRLIASYFVPVRGELLNLAESTSATQSCESFTYR